MELVTAMQMQEIDGRTIHEVGIPGRVLMESAGRGVVSALCRLAGGVRLKRVAVVAGLGNNGGDGFVVARYLADRGVCVTLFVVGDPAGLSGEALDNYRLLAPMGVSCEVVEKSSDLTVMKRVVGHSQMVVDALLGTGLQREVAGLYGEVVAAVNGAGSPIISVDMPSGVCADTGRVLGMAVKATATATFCRPKPGHFLFPGRVYTGELCVVDIGIPEREVLKSGLTTRLITPGRVSKGLSPLDADGHKGTRGHLLLVAGARGKSGAAILAAQAAVAGGAGLVTTALPASINTAFESTCVEAMSVPFPFDADGCFAPGCGEALGALMAEKAAVAIGPGLTRSPGALAALTSLIHGFRGPMLFDADALNLLSDNPHLMGDIKGEAVITPHPKEFSRLTGLSVAEIQANRLQAAVSFAVKRGLHVVLKGAGTVVAHPDGTSAINPTGNTLLATGGTGDVLAGLIGALLAQGYPCGEAAEMGVYLHGEVANRLWEAGLNTGMVASRLVARMPEVLSSALRGTLVPRAADVWVM